MYFSSLKQILYFIFQSAFTSKLKWSFPFKMNNFPIWRKETYYICKDKLKILKNYAWHLPKWDTFKSERQLCLKSWAHSKFFGRQSSLFGHFTKSREHCLTCKFICMNRINMKWAHIYCVSALPDRWIEIAFYSAIKVSSSPSVICNPQF